MRIAGQARGGYYPVPPEALSAALAFVKLKGKPQEVTVLDPCAGEGLALSQILSHLGLPRGNGYGIELSSDRGAKMRAIIESEDKRDDKKENVLEPASALGCECGANSFSLAWVNPPYDHELGGGQRVEMTFIQKVSPWIKNGGLLMLALPGKYAQAYSPVKEWLHHRYQNCTQFPYPPGHRKYGEVVIFGVKRESYCPEIPSDVKMNPLPAVPKDFVYTVPAGKHPWRFVKAEPTDLELGLALAASPLKRLREPPEPIPLPQPPMSLKSGHVAMLLASGHLDGIVRPKEGEQPHVVRGVAKKVMYLASTEETENESGSVTMKRIYSEKIDLIVRVVDGAGVLTTLTDHPPEEEAKDDSCEDDRGIGV